MKKKSSKKFKKILIFVFIILIIIGIIIWKNPSLKKKVADKIEEVIEVKKLSIVDEDSNERNIAVMINNHHSARLNHYGLNDAYIVYEAIVEGGLTRMMAIYKGKEIDRIGSVRSARHYFLDYALENDAIYVHFGWSPQAEEDIKSLGVDNLNGLYDDGYFRDNNLNVAYEHTAFTSIEGIKKEAESKGYSLTSNKKLLLNYNVDEINLNEIEENIPANNIDIVYSGYVTTSYTYDSVNKVYLRSVNGEEHTTFKDNERQRVTAKNIIIIDVHNYSIDNYGRQTLDNIGTGSGFYITNGYAVPIKWEKNSRTSQTVYTYLDGSEIKVNDGNTYIQIHPNNQEVSITE